MPTQVTNRRPLTLSPSILRSSIAVLHDAAVLEDASSERPPPPRDVLAAGVSRKAAAAVGIEEREVASQGCVQLSVPLRTILRAQRLSNNLSRWYSRDRLFALPVLENERSRRCQCASVVFSSI
jgi:hypothetical protein